MASSSTPIPRTRPLQKRESILRASILDTALELGVGSSSTVAHWIFNPIGEEDEEPENALSPSLTYASTATSDDSWFSQSSSLNRLASDASSNGGPPLAKPTLLDELPASQRAVQFEQDAHHQSPPEAERVSSKTRKLRKGKPDGGYESDGGYVSDAVAKDKKKSKKKGDGHVTGEESDGGYLSEVLARRRRKKKEKKEREKEKDLHEATDYETDGGYVSSVGKKEKKSKKSSNVGDESDGGNLSEASSKRKLFGFRRSNKARKRQDSDVSSHNIVPPVPTLPSVHLPIADRFGMSSMDLSSISSIRSATPTLSERTSTQRSSGDTSSGDLPSRGQSLSTMPSPLPSPNPSIQGLTSAFNDAQSVRTPSTDVLRAFGRQALPAASKSPLSSSTSFAQDSSTEQMSAVPSSFSAPTMGMPKPKRNLSQRRVPAEINVPNSRGLSVDTQHTTVPDHRSTLIPMTLTPPTPTPVVRPLRLVPKPEKLDTNYSPAASSFQTLPVTPASNYFDSVPSSPSAVTPSEFTIPSSLPSPASAIPTGSSAQFAIRAATLGKYDLPPPSPPPAGPLPQVPVEGLVPGRLNLSTNLTRRPNTADPDTRSELPVFGTSSPASLASRPGTAPIRPLPTPPRSPPRRGTSPARGLQSTPPVSSPALLNRSPSPAPGSKGGPPLFLQRIPSQRGRESPFPAQPVLTCKSSRTGLPAPASVSHSMSRTDFQHPASAGPVLQDAQRQIEHKGRLDISWQPRSASALDRRQDEDAQSWIDFDSRRESTSTKDSGSSLYQDIDSVRSAPRSTVDERTGSISGLYARRSGSGEEADVDDDDKSRYPDDEDDFDSRYSMFHDSDEPSRISILDKERSSNVRQQFLKRVEEMYSKEGIARGMAPPVPKLPPSSPFRI